MLPGRQQEPNPTNFYRGTWKPHITLGIPRQLTAKLTYGGVGIGGRKKRMSNCNGLDTGFNVTRYESEPTFDWSFLARELEEPSLRGKANDDNE